MQYWNMLRGEGFMVHCADPGLNATNLTGAADALRARGAPEPHVGGEMIAEVVRGERDADAGRGELILVVMERRVLIRYF